MKQLTKLKAISAALALALSPTLLAQELAITGATVHTMGEQGTVENATVLVEDGKIKSVRKGGRVPRGYQEIDASGKVVTPGVIGAYTALGLVEVEYSAGQTDFSVKMEDGDYLGTQMDVQYAVDPDSSLINIARVDGVTSALSTISFTDTLFGGQAAMITLGDKSDPIMKASAAITVDLTGDNSDSVAGGSRAVLWPKFMAILAEASSLKNLAEGEEWEGDVDKSQLEPLVPVMAGDKPLVVGAKRLSDIRNVLKVKAMYPDMDLVLLNPTEAWRAANQLAEQGIGVILNPETNLPYNFEQLGATLKNAARLHQAGVTVAIGVETHNIRLATQHAGNAVAHGLPWEAGLASVTSNVASLLGVDDQVGSLEPGKRADLVVWSGDPLEVMSFAENVIINGEQVPMESRQTKLRDRYLIRQNDRPYRYLKP